MYSDAYHLDTSTYKKKKKKKIKILGLAVIEKYFKITAPIILYSLSQKKF